MRRWGPALSLADYAGKAEYPGQRPEQRILPQMLDRMLQTAPPGADVRSWRY
jgi:hypothetical protein